MADMTAMARQERFAARNLATEITRLPEQQRSATIWDEAVLRTRLRDNEWIDANLGAWMQDYFGHSESYVLDHSNRPFFASIGKERLPPDVYNDRAEVIAPLVIQLRSAIAEVSEGLDNPYEELAKVSVVAPLQFDSGAAIVSVVPIISDTGEAAQIPGTESLHVAVRYVDASLAQKIGLPVELQAVAFKTSPPASGLVGIPVTDPSREVIAWLVWEPERPGMKILMRMLPALLGTGLAVVLLLWWIIRRLLRVSGQLQVSEAQARFLANHDALTGLPNRALFQDRLAQALHAADRTGQSVALLAIDLDRFKLINDSLGHPAGDELIRQVGSRLTELVRAGDTVARVGGDEFMVLLCNMTDNDALRRVCTKIVDELSRPYALLGSAGCVGASIGAVRTVAAQEDPEELVQRADMALYRAKAEGKGRYSLFENDLTSPVRHLKEIENDLRAALKSGTGLKLVYQPFYDREGQVTGAEALCRWDHPVHGALSPEIFIRVAEERGLIDELGRWALDKACHFAASTNLSKIAVNVSPLQLRNPSFVPMVLQTLENSGLAPTRLELELTERAVLEQSREIADILIRLRSIGIKIALDDFATGNSSLQYLRDHRVDCLKIERSFIARLGKDEESDRLVQAIFGLARATGVSVTVEGVETKTQHSLLASMGCKTFQGFLLSSPMEPEKFEELLRGEGTSSSLETT
ncbi:putative bifunctional diguanylate cyclase/phosphodiesterase [Paracoccus niistensis]|uniref:Bifunctional diguanylate cyclase/phosphodiesterase n=1 Tax=Paracoccus niistensis TaxID=632935 RepID=A0ABV6I435_9RHOB